jgi:DNA-directed RNA polymerase specialized sigma24 family protein
MPEAQDQEARFNRLYERHFDAVRAYAWRRAPGLADEIVAETFLVAWRRLPDVPDDALPWLIAPRQSPAMKNRQVPSGSIPARQPR